MAPCLGQAVSKEQRAFTALAGVTLWQSVWCLQACKADDLVFKERPLVGAQHTANKADALVCSKCFSMIGSIEQQIAHRLLAREENGTSRWLTLL